MQQGTLHQEPGRDERDGGSFDNTDDTVETLRAGWDDILKQLKKVLHPLDNYGTGG